jgi:hypothetical protein
MRVPLRHRDGASSGTFCNSRCRKIGAMAIRARRPMLPLIALILSTGLSGCAFTRGDLGVPFKEADIATIKPGQSSETDVARVLGAPDEIIRIGAERVVFHYYHYALKHATVLVFSRVNIGSDQLYVFFNERGIVDRVLSGNHTDQLEFQFWPFGA